MLKTGTDLITRLPDGTNTKDLIGEDLDGSKIKDIALDGNHDGVIQLRSNGEIGDLVVYSSNQIKSADPVTYDEQGNVIPLSQRFDQSRDEISYSLSGSRRGFITLFRGLESPYDPSYDNSRSDSPEGYSTWTDNRKLAEAYGDYVITITLPKSAMGKDYIDNNGERPLFYANNKPASIKGVKGKEFLVYEEHDDFSLYPIKSADSDEISYSLGGSKEANFGKYGEGGRTFTGKDGMRRTR